MREQGPAGEDGRARAGVRAGFARRSEAEVRALREPREAPETARYLVDLRGDMATELEVRRQLGNLEARVESVDGRVEHTNTRLYNSSLYNSALLFLLGALTGVIVGLLLGA